jgi:hypothetical protein
MKNPVLMKIYFIQFILLLQILSFSACTEEIALRINNEKPILVVNSLFNPDSTLKIQLMYSQNIWQNEIVIESEASIQLFENNLYKSDLNYLENGLYASKEAVFPENKYSIEISLPDNSLTAAFDSIPAPPVLSECYFNHPYKVNEENQEITKVVITLQDDKLSKDYYEIKLFHYYPPDSMYQITETKDDLDFELINTDLTLSNDIFSYNPGSVFFSDSSFNGQKYEIQLEVENFPIIAIQYNDSIVYYFDQTICFAYVKKISKAYYDYLYYMTKHLYSQNIYEIKSDEDLIQFMLSGEPTSMFSNISNGLGIFAAYSAIEQKIEYKNTSTK